MNLRVQFKKRLFEMQSNLDISGGLKYMKEDGF